MKPIMRAAALALSMLMLCGICASCGDDAEEISMYDLNKTLVAFTGDPDNMKYASSSDANPADLLVNVSDIDYSKVKAFFITYASDGKGKEKYRMASGRDPVLTR